MLEVQREDLRQLVAVTADFAGVDLGRGIPAIRRAIAENVVLPPDVTIEFGGLYEQQLESFRQLTIVLLAAILLLFTVLLLEFRSVLKALAILMGSVLALIGAVSALYLTGTSLNIVSYLGAIIGVGIVAKNGILILDYVDRMTAQGWSLLEALVRAGRRRLRPVLMTSMTTFLGLLPLAYGVGAGADLLRPLAIAVLGTLSISMLVSLVGTPVCYYVLSLLFRRERSPEGKAPFHPVEVTAP
jgi:multidrug efflux pump subunit AcrB